MSIASNDGPPAVRNRRRINQMNMPFRLKRQLQDPFEVQIDPFAGIDKGIHIRIINILDYI